MNLREAAQQALDELIAADGMPICNETDILDLSKTIETLRAALAEATINKMETVEPVAWMVYTQDGTSAFVTDNPKDFTDTHRALSLYTAPPKRKPLTEDEIDKAWRSVDYRISYDNFRIEVARAIEREHDIGDKNG